MTSLNDLIQRVEEGEGADRELDDAISMLCYHWLADLPRSEIGGWVHPAHGLVAPSDDFTISLDAVVSLIEQKLPGWIGDVDVGGFSLFVARLAADDGDFAKNISAQSKSPVRALLAAFLRAYQAQKEQG